MGIAWAMARRIDGTPINLSSGVTARPEVRTYGRRIIDYLLTSLRGIVSQPAHNR
jgi:hypothetical protein